MNFSLLYLHKTRRILGKKGIIIYINRITFTVVFGESHMKVLPPSHFFTPREVAKFHQSSAREPLRIDPGTSEEIPGNL